MAAHHRGRIAADAEMGVDHRAVFGLEVGVSRIRCGKTARMDVDGKQAARIGGQKLGLGHVRPRAVPALHPGEFLEQDIPLGRFLAYECLLREHERRQNESGQSC